LTTTAHFIGCVHFIDSICRMTYFYTDFVASNNRAKYFLFKVDYRLFSLHSNNRKLHHYIVTIKIYLIIRIL
jgi:hypothetical protein